MRRIAERRRSCAIRPGHPARRQARFHAFANNRPATLVGRLTGATRVPPRTLVPVTTTGMSTFAWAGAGRPKPLSSAVFSRTSLPASVAPGTFVTTAETLRFAAVGSELALVRDMSAGLTEFWDTQFVDPAITAIPDVRPASITAGVTPAASSSGDAIEDFRNLTRAYLAAGGELTNAVIILSSRDAVALALRSGSGTEPVFQNLTVTGGLIGGVPALASDSVSGQLIMVDASHVLIADADTIDVQRSRQATLEFSDAPTNNALTPTATTQISLFQTDSVAFRVERYVSWERVGAIARIDSIDYLSEGGSPA